MRLIVEYTGQLRSVVKRSKDHIEMPEGVTVTSLLEHLWECGDDHVRPHLLTQAGQLQSSLLIAINGTAHPSQQAATTVLRDGDTVVLLPPIAGG